MPAIPHKSTQPLCHHFNVVATAYAKFSFHGCLKVLDLYVWLSFRLEDSFPDRELASSQKSICSLWVLLTNFVATCLPCSSLAYHFSLHFRLIEEFLERLGWQKPKSRKLSRYSAFNSLLSAETRQHRLVGITTLPEWFSSLHPRLARKECHGEFGLMNWRLGREEKRRDSGG